MNPSSASVSDQVIEVNCSVEISIFIFDLNSLQHALLRQIPLWISLLESLQDLILHNINPWQLITQTHPSSSSVVWSSEELQLLSIWRNAVDDSVDFIRLTTCFSHLCQQHIAIEIPVEVFGVSLVSHQAMFLGVIEPMTSPSSSDNLIVRSYLDPNQFICLLVSPNTQALSSQLKRSFRQQGLHLSCDSPL